MLNCPFCQFENPEDQSICDQCGQPLQHWYSIVWANTPTVEVQAGDFLDPAHRYQCIGEPRPQITAAGKRIVTQRVVDCHPSLDSPLKELQTRWLDQPTLTATDLPATPALPSAALPYLALQADYFPAVPEIHDAWQTDQQTCLVLEDRSAWPRLTAVWPTQTGDPLQQTQWLFEITLLWQALAPWQGQTTLLNPDHLVLSPNSLLCLTQLDSDQGEAPTLLALGQVWQHRLVTETAPLATALKTLIQALVQGQFADVEQLQAALADLAGLYRSTPAVPGISPLPQGEAEIGGQPALNDSLDHSLDHNLDHSLDHSLDTPLFSDEDLIRLTETSPDLAEAEEGNGSLDLPTMVLPMKLLALEEAGQSHVGQQRHHNEDWFFTQTQLFKVNDPQGPTLQAQGLYILCDGMGGHASGEVASQLAVTTLRHYFAHNWEDDLPDQDCLTQAIIHTNQVLFNANQAKASAGIGRMGTTLVMLLVQDLQVAVVHVGDSRLYGYSKRQGFKQLTVDHEVGQREINRGVEPAIAYARPDAYQLTQALGPRSQDNLRPGITYQDIVEDTLFILCSDGLSDNDLLERHEDTHIAPLLSSRANLDQGVADLIQLANEKNGHDNITVILVRLKLRPDFNQLAN